MSTKASSWVWHSEATKNLKKHGLLVVLHALADIANDDGLVMFAKDEEMTQEALAAKSRMSVATFRRLCKELVDDGLLEVWRESATSNNSYRVLCSTAQNERSAPDEPSYPQQEMSDGTAHLAERSHRSAVSGQEDVLTSSTFSPQPPASQGAGPQPHPDIAAALRGQPLAGPDTRACKTHKRQRYDCLDCWSFRKLTISDVPWCGECQAPDMRFIHIDPDDPRSAVRRCPKCNPLAMTAAATAAANERVFGGSNVRGQGKDYALPPGDRA